MKIVDKYCTFFDKKSGRWTVVMKAKTKEGYKFGSLHFNTEEEARNLKIGDIYNGE